MVDFLFLIIPIILINNIKIFHNTIYSFCFLCTYILGDFLSFIRTHLPYSLIVRISGSHNVLKTSNYIECKYHPATLAVSEIVQLFPKIYLVTLGILPRPSYQSLLKEIDSSGAQLLHELKECYISHRITMTLRTSYRKNN